MAIARKTISTGLTLGATVVTLSTIAVTSLGIHSRGQALFEESPKELIDEVWQVINRQYVDGTFNQVDWQAVRREYLNKSYTNKQEAYKSIREMLKKLEDPYTRFMDPQEFKSMQVDTSGELTGIGIQIGLDEKTKKLTVIAPIDDTPASKAGLLAKDIIVMINGKSTEGMDTNEAVALIRGEPGTQVKLTILRNNQQKEFTITRARIEIHPVEYSLKESSAGKIGYIRLKQFSANASKEMRDAIKNLENKQVTGYILDLRSNPGGLLFSSVEIARMWMDKGGIVSTIDRRGEVEKEVANGRALTNKPLVVLVDKGSASASEILSGALQDNKRAVVVGSQTFGKGLVQSVRPLGDGSGLAVTIAKYHTPSGKDINKHGINPDIIVDLNDKQRQDLWLNERDKIGTLADPQFAKAVEVLGKEIAAQGSRADKN
ncbi:MAG: S41 family peptidase [Chlorogloeopsis fritschii C42_A2020_084]|jgi:carboxyl-terminal processing protease|uniref:carboxyl-terminal processing protease CtpC n=1 Tax=Chlorogloeopsis fritschii TaxID=1124 RepID=UPI001A0D05F2|nr:carboxyl-terminal processing protease CtpC [Chlorogloeopsis fritschii]MBF2007302.1 S41 family peptidase [Chlorogloeopsis fritschii C42_A2020_084]